MTWDGYAATWAGLHGGFDPRRASLAVRGWLRAAYLVGTFLGRLGVAPAAVTAIGVLFSLTVPVLAGAGPGWPLLAGVLVLLAVAADSVDGAVAVVTSRITRLGYVYDSLADRLGELSWAVALCVVGVPWPLPMGCVALAWLHEYARARARVAGMKWVGTVTTVGERPMRVSVVLAGLLLAGLAGLLTPEFAAGTATVVTAVWAVLGLCGFHQLLGAVRATLR